MDNAIVANGLRKRYGNTIALDGVSFSVPSGSVYCIVGPNGSGKTTLLNVISGSVMPDEGSITSSDTIGYCHQNPMLYSDLSIHQNIGLFSELLSAKRDWAERAIDMLFLRDKLGERVSELSSGTRKKVELCIAMLADPGILVLDEPIAGFDRESSKGIIRFIKSMAGKKTVIIATHQLAELRGIGTHLMVLEKGKKAYEKKGVRDLEKAYKA